MKKFFLVALGCVSLAGCFGYHIGPAKPYYLRDVRSIAVPTFGNDTTIPHIEVMVTDTVIKQFQQDGTFRIASNESADAILKAEVVRINRLPARSVSENVLQTSEFSLAMRVRYKLVDHSGKAIAPSAEVTGTTSFFVNYDNNAADIVSDEQQALPLAAEELANHLVTQLSEGW
ncbi:MAG TPA: LptE family protein [Chthoniobacterales bacterium]|nr:LptE family protein [Chthoniobacterales bacterium]